MSYSCLGIFLGTKQFLRIVYNHKLNSILKRMNKLKRKL